MRAGTEFGFARAGPAPAAQALLRLLDGLRAQGHPLPEEVSWAGGADRAGGRAAAG